MPIRNVPILATFKVDYYGDEISAVSWNLSGEDPDNYIKHAQFLKQQNAGLIALQEVEEGMLPILQKELGSDWTVKHSPKTKMISCYRNEHFSLRENYDIAPEIEKIEDKGYKCRGFYLLYKGGSVLYFINFFSDRRTLQTFDTIYNELTLHYPDEDYGSPTLMMIVGDMGTNLARKGGNSYFGKTNETIATGILSPEERQRYYGMDDSAGDIQVYSSGGFEREGMDRLKQMPIRPLKPINEISKNIQPSDSNFFKPVYKGEVYENKLRREPVFAQFFESQQINDRIEKNDKYLIFPSANAHNEFGVTLRFHYDSFSYPALKNKFTANPNFKFYSRGVFPCCSTSSKEMPALQKEIEKLNILPFILSQLDLEIERLKTGSFTQALGIFASSKHKKSSFEQLKNDIEQQLANEMKQPDDNTLIKLREIITTWQKKHVNYDGKDQTNKDLISKHRNRFHLPWGSGPTRSQHCVEAWLSKIDSLDTQKDQNKGQTVEKKL